MTALEAARRRRSQIDQEEAVRQAAKRASFLADFAGERAGIEVLDGFEVVVVDELLFYETITGTAAADGSVPTWRARPDGPGQGPTYAPARRFLLFCQDRGGGLAPSIHGREVRNLDDLAWMLTCEASQESQRNYHADAVLAVAADRSLTLDNLASPS